MKKIFVQMPKPVQRQIYVSFGAGLLFLFLFLILLIIENSLKLALPGLVLAIFFCVYTVRLFYIFAQKKYLCIKGTVTHLEMSTFRRQIKTLFINSEYGIIKLSYRRFSGEKLQIGGEVRLYLSEKTSIYEKNGVFLLSGYLAVESIEKNAKRD